MYFKGKRPLTSIVSKTADARANDIHIIVCPFCDNGHPIPTDFDSIHRCTCGACFKVCGTDTLETGVGDIASTLWSEDELSLVRAVPIDFCNVVIEKNFDRLLDLRHTSPNDSGMERFCKYDVNLDLSLVRVKRLL